MGRRQFQPNWGKLIPFIGFHIAAIAGIAAVGVSGRLLALCFGLYLLRIFGTTAGYHRYFSHRSFKTSRPMQFLLGVIANFSLMRGPLTWAQHHRYHHRHADAESDLHSPRQRGFWFSHCGWFLSKEYDETALFEVRDLEKFPELRWLNRHYYLPSYLLAACLWRFWGFPAFVWGFLVSTVISWHMVFTINSFAHRFGRRRFATSDDSRNNAFLAVLLLGEGWHNNHHHYMHSARQGFRWWEVDITWYVLWTLSKVGLIWDLRPAPENKESASDAAA
jgi:stearoyl-CoA desaturase (delta-9 desaturase)